MVSEFPSYQLLHLSIFCLVMVPLQQEKPTPITDCFVSSRVSYCTLHWPCNHPMRNNIGPSKCPRGTVIGCATLAPRWRIREPNPFHHYWKQKSGWIDQVGSQEYIREHELTWQPNLVLPPLAPSPPPRCWWCPLCPCRHPCCRRRDGGPATPAVVVVVVGYPLPPPSPALWWARRPRWGLHGDDGDGPWGNVTRWSIEIGTSVCAISNMTHRSHVISLVFERATPRGQGTGVGAEWRTCGGCMRGRI